MNHRRYLKIPYLFPETCFYVTFWWWGSIFQSFLDAHSQVISRSERINPFFLYCNSGFSFCHKRLMPLLMSTSKKSRKICRRRNSFFPATFIKIKKITTLCLRPGQLHLAGLLTLKEEGKVLIPYIDLVAFSYSPADTWKKENSGFPYTPPHVWRIRPQLSIHKIFVLKEKGFQF